MVQAVCAIQAGGQRVWYCPSKDATGNLPGMERRASPELGGLGERVGARTAWWWCCRSAHTHTPTHQLPE